jgi:hypothetical protein
MRRAHRVNRPPLHFATLPTTPHARVRFFAKRFFFATALVLTCDARDAVVTMNCWGMRRMEWRFA